MYRLLLRHEQNALNDLDSREHALQRRWHGWTRARTWRRGTWFRDGRRWRIRRNWRWRRNRRERRGPYFVGVGRLGRRWRHGGGSGQWGWWRRKWWQGWWKGDRWRERKR